MKGRWMFALALAGLVGTSFGDDEALERWKEANARVIQGKTWGKAALPKIEGTVISVTETGALVDRTNGFKKGDSETVFVRLHDKEELDALRTDAKWTFYGRLDGSYRYKSVAGDVRVVDAYDAGVPYRRKPPEKPGK
jgi:hypothetical protein